MSCEGKISPETAAKASLLNYLFTKKMLNTNSGVVNELPLDKSSRRIDIALLGTKIIFFEIKSKADKLIRLEGQSKVFSRYCDKLIILCAQKHVSNVLKTAHQDAGVWQLNDDLSIKMIRAGRENRLTDRGRLLELINLGELRYILRDYGISASGKRRKVALLLAEDIPLTKLRSAVLEALKKRHSKLNKKLFLAFSKNGHIKGSNVLALRRRERNTLKTSKTTVVKIGNIDDEHWLQLAAQSGGQPFGEFPHKLVERSK